MINADVYILGQVWSVEEKTSDQDEELKDCDGYCKPDVHLIVIDADPDITNKEKYKKQVLRHEIIHAFLFESGLGYNINVAKSGHDE
ncbi:MAG: hypothetical protein MJ097_06335, partial [Dorea sp.]|nr:hypothetical protein [Dorea sp.]